MANLLEQLDQLVQDSLVHNVYSDSNQYTDLVNKNSKNTPIMDLSKVTTQDLKNNLYDSNFPTLISAKGGTFSLEQLPKELRFVDIFSTAHWMRNIGKEFGLLATDGQRSPQSITKGITWAASQFLLTALNPMNPELGGPLNAVWNPLSLVASAIPGMRSTVLGTGVTLASAGGLEYKTTKQQLSAIPPSGLAPIGDRMLLMRKGLYVKPTGLGDLAQLDIPKPGFSGDTSRVGEYDTLESPTTYNGKPITIEGQLGETTDLLPKPGTIHSNLYNVNNKYGDISSTSIVLLEKDIRDSEKKSKEQKITPESVDLQKTKDNMKSIFSPQKFPGDKIIGADEPLVLSWLANKPGKKISRGSDTPNNLSVRFTELQEENGVVDDIIQESNADSLYMPFSFQDLRETEVRVYFRAFLKSGLNETFTPEWAVNKYYGRVDSVPTYQGTMRTFNVSFDVVAFGPADLPVMWKKLNKLQSMVYPEFNKEGFLNRGPVIKIRIGDLICSSNKTGLPGYINSLDFAYDDGVWNLETGFKVPRKVSVSLGFTVLHEGNPGIYPFAEINGGNADEKTTFGSLASINSQGGEISDAKVSVGNIRGVNEKVEEYYTSVLKEGSKK